MTNILLADTGAACVSADCQNHAPASQQLTPQHRHTQQLLSSCMVSTLADLQEPIAPAWLPWNRRLSMHHLLLALLPTWGSAKPLPNRRQQTPHAVCCRPPLPCSSRADPATALQHPSAATEPPTADHPAPEPHQHPAATAANLGRAGRAAADPCLQGPSVCHRGGRSSIQHLPVHTLQDLCLQQLRQHRPSAGGGAQLPALLQQTSGSSRIG